MNDNVIVFDDVDFVYGIDNDSELTDKQGKNTEYEANNRSYFENYHKALSGLNVNIKKGEFVAVLGRNGCGKSTFARHINAILVPVNGSVKVNEMDTKEEKYLWDIRQFAGMIFQNPDNQIVGTVVEEDVAFGPENIGIDPKEIRTRVDNALKVVGMYEYKEFAPHLLSGGQKQRIAIAGILAMKPQCIILDEATAMLDPAGRKEIMKVVHDLNKEYGITVIHITHHMDEAVIADRVIVMDKGKVVLEGKPKDVFSNVEKIKSYGLDVPQATELIYELKKDGVNIKEDVLDIDEAVEVISSILKS